MGAMNTSSADVSFQIRLESCSSRSSGNWYRAWIYLKTRDGKLITFDAVDAWPEETTSGQWFSQIGATMRRLMVEQGIDLPDFPECP